MSTTAAPEKLRSNLHRNGSDHKTERVQNRTPIFDGGRRSAGSTLMELVVTLSILGLILTSGISFGIGMYEKIENRRFNDECENLLNEILAVRNTAIMTNNLPAGCKLYARSAMFFHYDTSGKRQTHTTVFETFSIQEISGVLEIRFDATGTISRSTTLTLVSKNGKKRQLVFQVASGRVYLTDGD